MAKFSKKNQAALRAFGNIRMYNRDTAYCKWLFSGDGRLMKRYEQAEKLDKRIKI